MARFPFIFSLTLSILLISGAGWYRLSEKSSGEAVLLTVKDNISAQYAGEAYLGGESATSTLPGGTTLSEADLVARQLFSDYISLRSNGQVSPENLADLAEKYAVSLLQSDEITPVTLDQIKIVADSNERLVAYNQKISALRAKHVGAARISGSEFVDVFDESFINLMIRASLQYKLAAQDLASTEVPASLASNHVALINNYLSSSLRLSSMAKINEHPITALSAMKKQSENSMREEELISNIRVKLISRGLLNASL